ncbi:MAG: DUF4139 domain-containing protein [Clostridiales Family XIII bacterium]|jgi:uncharacterized protein (TIGR02231 family)|nr:DUF4139 domain-containing protein [Clostridiales Family XIII bacterium]
MSSQIQTASRITKATVYLFGAQVTRTAAVTARGGAGCFVFSGLPAGLDAESIQASVQGAALIRSIAHRIDYLPEKAETGNKDALQKQLSDLQRQYGEENSKLQLCDLEEGFLTENRQLGGSKAGLQAGELKEATAFYRERMASILAIRLESNEKAELLRLQIDAVAAQLGSAASPGQDPASEIAVTLAADTETAIEIELSYFVRDAGWTPTYDIRVRDTAGPVALHYQAKVFQNTGEKWTDVKLTLSTGNPGVHGECPALSPWYLDIAAPVHPIQAPFNAAPMMKKMRAMEMEMDEMRCEEIPLPVQAKPAVTVTESVTSVEYNIAAPYTIPAGDDGQDVEIAMHSLSTKYRYYSVRKLEREVFLLAAVRDWESLNLLAGEASVYFENRYVGKTFIDPRRADEEIDLSLGTDPSVVVTRVRGKDFTAKTLTGSSLRQTRQWELAARNLKSAPIDIEIADQLPVSVNKQLTVDAVEVSGAAHDKDTGILTWRFSLEPAASRSMTVKYVVTGPKDAAVALD